MALTTDIATTTLAARTLRSDRPVVPHDKLSAHRALGDALKMCTRGDGADVMISRLRTGGLSEREAARARLAIERQVCIQHARFRYTRSRAVVSVYAQLVLAVVMIALDLTTSRLISAAVLGVLLCRAWARVCRPRASMPAIEVTRCCRS